ncbi:MAG: undecaprenyl-diphosphate phosphatase [Candidatus Omnitrophica bacterium]|nr:undecaprenyl-diphosphate phosphatase [Candidatus Omnitrophota bacterium]
MNLFQALFLGIVQGLTEFLPVSSSAHLVITQNLFGLSGPILLVFDVVVHLGTLLSLFFYFGGEFFKFRKQGVQTAGNLAQLFSLRMFWLVILATIPTGVIGLLLRKWMEENFNSLKVTVVTLLINSCILWSTRWIGSGEKKESAHWLDAIWVGIAQGISILPGISRSGATCTTALWLKIKAEEAARFSFLIAIPAILGATVVVLPESISSISSPMWPALIAGFFSAFISGYTAILILFRIMLRGKFHLFAIYTFALAILAFLFSLKGI